MNTRSTLIAFFASIFFALLSSARSESVAVNAESFTAPKSAIKQTGFDWVFLPYKQPFDPKNPQIEPFDSRRPFRGVFTPDQVAVVRRALSAESIKNKELISESVPTATQINIPSTDGKDSPAISVSATTLPDKKIQIKIFGSDPTVFQEASIASGDTIVLTFAANETDSVAVYFIQIKNG